GKSELLWHAHEGKQFAGPAWFGEPSTVGHSLWVDDREYLKALQLDRDALPDGVDAALSHGTSALILGFRDPEEETRPDAKVLLDKIGASVAKSFFPAMVEGRLCKLAVSLQHVLDGRIVSVMPVQPEKSVPE